MITNLMNRSRELVLSLVCEVFVPVSLPKVWLSMLVHMYTTGSILPACKCCRTTSACCLPPIHTVGPQVVIDIKGLQRVVHFLEVCVDGLVPSSYKCTMPEPVHFQTWRLH